MQQTSKIYVVEHMEEFLYDWCMHEYMQMLKYLNKTSLLIVTNHKVIDQYLGKSLANNQTNLNQLNSYIQQNGYQPHFFRLPMNVHDYKQDKILKLNRNIPMNRVCLLDMRGTAQLKPEDADNFDVFIFGGILGDHPPRDRTSSLRTEDCQMRHLGELQFSTDTAILVTKLIIEKKMPFEKIQFVDEPEMVGQTVDGIQSSVQMEGFRYITTNYDPLSESFKGESSQQPLMAQFIREKLMFDDFDLGEMILEPQ